VLHLFFQKSKYAPSGPLGQPDTPCVASGRFVANDLSDGVGSGGREQPCEDGQVKPFVLEREREVTIEVCTWRMARRQDAPCIVLNNPVMVPRCRKFAGQGHRQAVGIYQCAVACQGGGLRKTTFLKNDPRARKKYLLVRWHEFRFLEVKFCWKALLP
jgi:hypothetical protein